MIPESFLDELRSRVDVVDVVGRHVALKKSGSHHKGLCPFHAEKSPSFTVSASRQKYHCFGCGAGGDAVAFLVEHLGLTFPDAVRDLAGEVGLQVPEDDRRAQDPAVRERRASMQDVLAKAAEHYRAQLKASPTAVDYLKRRGLTGEIAAQFGLGYAPDAWRGLASAFPSYDDPLLEEAGLVLTGGEPSDDPSSRRRYDRFRHRIMFPIRSVQGAVIGFGGRVLDAGGTPKYLNSPETPVFNKGHELYGLHEARAAIRAAGHVLVVEGYMDVVALAQLGVRNAVATLGTACTAEHVQKLFRHTDKIVFSFDGDAAGRRASGRALEVALPHVNDVRSVRFLTLPPEHDPDSYVRAHGADAFRRSVAAAAPLSGLLLDLASAECNLAEPEGRAQFASQARRLWTLLPDGALKSQLLVEIAARAGLPGAELATLWAAPIAGPGRHAAAVPERSGRATGMAPPFSTRRPRADAANLLERALWVLVHGMEAWQRLDAGAQSLLGEQPAPYGALFRCIERCLADHGPLPPDALLAELSMAEADDEPAASAVLARVRSFHPPEAGTDDAAPQAQRQLAILLDRLRLRSVQDELTALFDSGVDSPDAQGRSAELLRTQAALKMKLATVQEAAS